jgi:hypothetical protein
MPAPARDDASGRYARESLCDCCGKPVRDYCSDDAVMCLPGSGVLGLIVCERKRCDKRVAGKTPAERLAVYRAQAPENAAALTERRKAKTVKL